MNPNQASDLELIAWIKQGKTHLFSQLVDRYKHKSMTLAISVIQDKHLAEDVTQEAFISAFQNLPKYQPSATFGAWLYRIVLNASLNVVKKRKKEFFSLAPESPDEIDMAEESTIYPGELPIDVDSEYSQARIFQTLEKLKPSETLMLRLFYLMELSIIEIEGVTGLSSANIKTTLHRARGSFKKHWHSSGG